MRKKILSVVLAATMVLGMATTVFAAPSPATTGAVSTVSSAKDASGNDVQVTLSTTFTAEEQKAVDTIKTTEGLKEAMGADFTENMVVLDVKEVSVPAGTTFPVTITFDVPGATANSKGSILHWNGSAWEKIATTFGNGTMAGTFSSLSPVAFVLDKTTASTGTNSGSSSSSSSATSPKTNENFTGATVAALIAVAALGGAFVVRRKRA